MKWQDEAKNVCPRKTTQILYTIKCKCIQNHVQLKLAKKIFFWYEWNLIFVKDVKKFGMPNSANKNNLN